MIARPSLCDPVIQTTETHESIPSPWPSNWPHVAAPTIVKNRGNFLSVPRSHLTTRNCPPAFQEDFMLFVISLTTNECRKIAPFSLHWWSPRQAHSQKQGPPLLWRPHTFENIGFENGDKWANVNSFWPWLVLHYVKAKILLPWSTNLCFETSVLKHLWPPLEASWTLISQKILGKIGPHLFSNWFQKFQEFSTIIFQEVS